MVDIMDVYKSVNISIGTVMKNPEMINLFLIILKLKKCLTMLLKNHLIYLDMLLINIRLSKCVLSLIVKVRVMKH